MVGSLRTPSEIKIWFWDVGESGEMGVIEDVHCFTQVFRRNKGCCRLFYGPVLSNMKEKQSIFHRPIVWIDDMVCLSLMGNWGFEWIKHSK